MIFRVDNEAPKMYSESSKKDEISFRIALVPSDSSVSLIY